MATYSPSAPVPVGRLCDAGSMAHTLSPTLKRGGASGPIGVSPSVCFSFLTGSAGWGWSGCHTSTTVPLRSISGTLKGALRKRWGRSVIWKMAPGLSAAYATRTRIHSSGCGASVGSGCGGRAGVGRSTSSMTSGGRPRAVIVQAREVGGGCCITGVADLGVKYWRGEFLGGQEGIAEVERGWSVSVPSYTPVGESQ